MKNFSKSVACVSTLQKQQGPQDASPDHLVGWEGTRHPDTPPQKLENLPKYNISKI